jgi:resuscitation-promoting factor RpfB
MAVPPRPDVPESLVRRGWRKFRSWQLWRQVLVGLAVLWLISLALSPLADDAATTSQGPLSGAATETPSFIPPSASAGSVEVPSVVGLSESSATNALEQAGLTVDSSSQISAKKPGTVLDQSPSGGTLEPGSSVAIFVAKPYPEIPEVVGLKLSAARERLKNAGFDAKVRHQVSAKPVGTVISQSPSGGTGAKPGRVVTIVVAKASASSGGGSSGGGSCDPSYPSVCIPPYPPDLDCGEVPYTNFTVIGSDPHGFDGDNDGIGCES